MELILFAVFGLESTLGLFPPGMDPGKIYNPLLEMSDPRGMPNETPPFLKKKSKYFKITFIFVYLSYLFINVVKFINFYNECNMLNFTVDP